MNTISPTFIRISDTSCSISFVLCFCCQLCQPVRLSSQNCLSPRSCPRLCVCHFYKIRLVLIIAACIETDFPNWSMVVEVEISLTHATTMASRQDKATADRNARTLRELVKMPQNKFCADCKRNGTASPYTLIPNLMISSPSRRTLGFMEYVSIVNYRGWLHTCSNYSSAAVSYVFAVLASIAAWARISARSNRWI